MAKKTLTTSGINPHGRGARQFWCAKKTPTSIRVNKTLFASFFFFSCLVLHNLALLFHGHVGAEKMMIATIRRKVQEG